MATDSIPESLVGIDSNLERAAELIRLAGARQVDQLATLLAIDAILEMPFAPRGMIQRYEGRGVILDFLRKTSRGFSSFGMTIDALYQTREPGVVIVEHHSQGVVAASSRVYENRYVTVFGFSGESKVRLWREYFDAGAVVRAFAAGGP